MSHDPRYPDDGLAELVDELELLVSFEAWRPRYVLGMDGTRTGGVVTALELRAHGLFLLPEPPLTNGVLP